MKCVSRSAVVVIEVAGVKKVFLRITVNTNKSSHMCHVFV